jgi:hypothetical protein
VAPTKFQPGAVTLCNGVLEADFGLSWLRLKKVGPRLAKGTLNEGKSYYEYLPWCYGGDPYNGDAVTASSPLHFVWNKTRCADPGGWPTIVWGFVEQSRPTKPDSSSFIRRGQIDALPSKKHRTPTRGILSETRRAQSLRGLRTRWTQATKRRCLSRYQGAPTWSWRRTANISKSSFRCQSNPTEQRACDLTPRPVRRSRA